MWKLLLILLFIVLFGFLVGPLVDFALNFKFLLLSRLDQNSSEVDLTILYIIGTASVFHMPILPLLP